METIVLPFTCATRARHPEGMATHRGQLHWPTKEAILMLTIGETDVKKGILRKANSLTKGIFLSVFVGPQNVFRVFVRRQIENLHLKVIEHHNFRFVLAIPVQLYHCCVRG